MTVAPIDATTISVLHTLHKLDNDFGAMATAFENGEFALWVGSGISRKAPSLGNLVTRAVEFLRQRTADPATSARFRPALATALRYGGVEIADVEPHLGVSFSLWPNYTQIRDALWNRYSELLDVRLQGEPSDFMLWDAVDVRDAFSHPAPPASEQLSIAVLILEGALQEIASANWDGFIEAAVEQLAGTIHGNLQVVVDPAHLRDAPGKARLLKFHGCIIHATDDPATYRNSLIASKTQILNWPEAQATAAMRAEVVSAATNLKALMVGLSLQDVNLQSVFVRARQANPWPWPSTPHAQAHVFCENEIGEGQRQILKTVYADAYNDNIPDIEASAHLQAWGEQVLLAFVLKVITDKLTVLMRLSVESKSSAASADQLAHSLKQLRDAIAAQAVGDRTAFANSAIAMWSRMISLFRTGELPAAPNAYQLISGSSLGQLAQDANARAASFGELAIALALLSDGQAEGLWQLSGPTGADLSAGALTSTPTWESAQPRAIFFVRSAKVALDLQKSGAFANDNTIVIHADDAWHQLQQRGTPSPRRPKRSPGRTGGPTTLHVSITQIAEAEPDIAALRKRFSSEVIL
ncbi:hypothetical protein ACVWYQ_006530 [Bradyrhizobium sp. USDA 3397]